MKQLFDDFIKYVDAMDSDDIAKSISDAIKHSAEEWTQVNDTTSR